MAAKVSFIDLLVKIPPFLHKEQQVLFSINFDVEEMIRNGADVNERDNYIGSFKRTPLHYIEVICSRNMSIIRDLIRNGADVNAKDKLGRTPLHYITETSRSHLFQLKTFTKEEFFTAVDILLENGADINAKDNYGTTPLHRCIDSDIDVIIGLVQRGASVVEKNNKGNTPLHYICKHIQSHKKKKRHLEIVKFLLCNGADHTITNNEGKQALEYLEKEIADSLLTDYVYHIKEF